MRDIQEVRSALAATGPDATILHLWPDFTSEPFADTRDALLWGWNPNSAGGEVVLRIGRFPVCFPARLGPAAVVEEPRSSLIFIPGPPPPPRMKHWGLVKLGSGVWGVTPSIVTPGVVHAYVVLCGAPDPAPWEVPPTVYGNLKGDLR